jgi:predicted adenylyl cyclase CyaB
VRTGTTTEVELKFLEPDLDQVRQRLRDAGARLEQPRELETNIVFDDANHSLRDSKRLLRLRNGHELTVKIPLEDPTYKARREINLDVAEGEVEAFLEGLGFTADWRYEKWREGWDLDGMFITLDELPFIGAVVEIEGDREKIDSTASKLGLAENRTSTANYSGLYREYADAHGIEGGDMTFAAEADLSSR